MCSIPLAFTHLISQNVFLPLCLDYKSNHLTMYTTDKQLDLGEVGLADVIFLTYNLSKRLKYNNNNNNKKGSTVDFLAALTANLCTN